MKNRTPLGAVAAGVIAGAAGTGLMTAWQTAAARLQGPAEPESQAEKPQDPWEQASAPAILARRIADGVFQRQVSPDLIPLLTNVMHWGYGTGWGVVYSVLTVGRRGSGVRRGVGFGRVQDQRVVPSGLGAAAGQRSTIGGS